MKMASVSFAKNNLSALLQAVRAGQTVVITDRGVPVARLEPVTTSGAGGAGLEALVRSGVVGPAGGHYPLRRSGAWTALLFLRA